MLIAKTMRGFQIGLETTPGTAVPADKKFKNATMKPTKRDNNTQKADNDGHKSAIGTQLGKRSSSFDIAGKTSYNIMPYWISMIYGISAITPSVVVASEAFSYGKTMSSTNVDTPQTMTIEYGNNQGFNDRIAFATAMDFTFKVSQASCEYGLTGFGLYPSQNITLTASPTVIAANLVNFGDFRVSYAAAYSDLGTGKLLTSKEIEFNVKSKYMGQFFIDDATTSFGGILEKIPDITGQITVAKGTESDQFLAQLETGALGYLQIQGTGPLLATVSMANTYASILYTMCMSVSGETNDETDSLYVSKYDFYSAEDVVNGDINCTAVCGLATL